MKGKTEMQLDLTIDDLRELEQYPGLMPHSTVNLNLGKREIKMRRDYHRDYALSSLLIMFFIFSAIGWIWEVIIHIVEDGQIVNRGTLHGPWLPIYGVGGVLGVVLFKRFVDRPVVTFVLVTALCTIVEYITGWYLKTYKHIKYWDYEGYFLNINGLVCLEGALIFGFAGYAGVYLMAPFFDDKIKKIPEKIRKNVCITFTIVFAFDFIYSHFYPNKGEGITDYVVTFVHTFSQMF